MSQHLYAQRGPRLWDASPLPSCDATPAPDYRACVLVGHQWQAVSLNGRQQCQVCRIIAYCPSCTSTFLSTALLVFCPMHQEGTR